MCLVEVEFAENFVNVGWLGEFDCTLLSISFNF